MLNLRVIRFFLILVAIIVITDLNFQTIDLRDNEVVEVDQIHSSDSDESDEPVGFIKQDKSLYTYMGADKELLLQDFGNPERVDLTRYNYNWWVYPLSKKEYVMFGVREGQIVTIFGIGENVTAKPFYNGMAFSDIVENVQVNSEVTVVDSLNQSYRFELSEEELHTRPLVEYQDIYVQLYVDRFTQKLSSIRFFDVETLLAHRPYNLVYRGTLPEVQTPSINEWRNIEEGSERQILDITNIIRTSHGLPELRWHNEASIVAYNHSYDMNSNQFFAHESPTHGGVAQRLKVEGINFTTAGENIAAQYEDGISATHGWLNSKGHRDIMLSEGFTHIGIGVYKEYYTQEYLTPF